MPAPERGGAFDLHVLRQDLDVRYEDGSGGGPLEIGRLGVSFYESIAAGARLGIRLGAAGVSQTGRSATAGLDPSGQFLELDFSGAWPHTGPVGLWLGLGWRYTSADAGYANGDTVDLDWQTVVLRPAVELRPTRHLAARLGASVISVDGSERRRGSTNVTTDFRADGDTGAFAALEFLLGGGDVISIRLDGGNPSGAYISFEQRY